MKKYTTFVICFFMHGPLLGWFSYDRAVLPAQHGAWDQAKQALTQLLVENPDKADLLYDAGVASYQTKDFEQADAYFQKVTECSGASEQLKEQAYFNQGNSLVARQQLEQAIVAYEKALEINPENERARHNRDKVKEMLEQQKQQQQKEEEDNKHKNQDSEKKSDESSPSKNDNNDESGNDEKDESNQKNSSGKKEQQEKGDNKQDEQSGSEQENSQGDQDGGQDDQTSHENKQDKQRQRDRHGKEDERADNNPHQQRGNDPRDEKTKNDKQNQPHEPSEQTEQQEEDMNNGGQAQELDDMGQEPLDDQQLDERIAYILKQFDKHDAQLQKQMVKATVGKKMAGAHGQNNW